MSDTQVPSYRIEHLKSAENYPTWSVQIKDILTEAGLFDIVSGVTPRPALQTDSGDNSVAVNSWDAKDKRALANIRTRMSSAMISYTINAMTSKQPWDSLKSIFDINALDLNKVGKAFGFAVPPRVNVTVGGGKSGAGKSGKRKRDNNDDEDGEDNFDEDEAVRDSDNGDDHEVSEKPTGGRRQGKSRRLETMGKKKVGKEFYKKSKEKHSKKGSVQWSR